MSSEIAIETAVDRKVLGQASKKAMDYLARREHSCHELTRKLTAAGFESGLVEQVIDRLRSDGLLSDHRFAEAYIRYRASRGQGPTRIRMELGEKGVRGGLVDELMSSVDRDWYQLAVEVRLKKFGEELPRDYKERARQARFLQYRGFDNDQIQHALDGFE